MRRTRHRNRIALILWSRKGSLLADGDTNLGPQRFPAQGDWRAARAHSSGSNSVPMVSKGLVFR
jgi:hypothetical protein